MKMNTDLGYSHKDLMASMVKFDEEQYPTVRFEGKESLDLPAEGTLTVKFKRIREENSVNEEGDHRYSCTLELTKLVNVDGASPSPTKRHNTAADALDKLLKIAEKDSGEDEDY